MEFQYKGANSVQITTKEGVLLTDPDTKVLGGAKAYMNKAGVFLVTDSNLPIPEKNEAFVINSPGEYEVKGFAIQGRSVRGHMAAEGESDKRIIYRISANDINVAFLGHIYPELSEELLEMLGVIDVLILPVGGNGYTMDAVGAANIVKRIAPKAVIPTHYADSSIAYPVPQNELEPFVKEVGATLEETDKLKYKADTLSEGLTIYQLKKG